MSTIPDQQLIALAETHVTRWVSGGSSSTDAAVAAGLRFEESGRLFGSDPRRFLNFLHVMAGDAAYRFHWAVSRCRQRSVHIRVYLTPIASGGSSRSATLRLRLHMAEDGSLMGLTVIYRAAKLIDCLAPNRSTAYARRLFNAFRLYRVRL